MKRTTTPELLVLTALSALSHFWRLFTPNAVVFDELHYKHFAGHYLQHTFYFDVHPPLANLLYALVAHVAGVSADTLLGNAPVTILRVLPAFCGTLLVPLGYAILRQLGARRRVATLAGLALLAENALLVDTRFTLVEPLILSSGLAALSLDLAARRSMGASRWALLAASALFAGAALSFKWTGASALGIILTLWAVDVWKERRVSPRAMGEASLLAGVPIVVYVVTFAVHFALLTHVGVGEAAMSASFRNTLIGWPQYDSTAHMSLAAKIADIHGVMNRGNRELEYATHPASSPWYTWPIMKHPIALWENEAAGAGRKQMIVLLGNPVLWWGGMLGVVFAAGMLLRRRSRSPERQFALAFLLGAFAIDFVPFMFITRLMYIYHYLFALVFAVLLGAYVLGSAAGWNDGDDALFRFESARSARLYWGVVALIIVAFAYFSPLSYGWTISQRAFDNRFWVLHPHL
ncbi:MAG: phospholipid carrier-dependent glycosyltransferase [Gemmatimonadaceae bacterium]